MKEKKSWFEICTCLETSFLANNLTRICSNFNISIIYIYWIKTFVTVPFWNCSDNNFLWFEVYITLHQACKSMLVMDFYTFFYVFLWHVQYIYGTQTWSSLCLQMLWRCWTISMHSTDHEITPVLFPVPVAVIIQTTYQWHHSKWQTRFPEILWHFSFYQLIVA